MKTKQRKGLSSFTANTEGLLEAVKNQFSEEHVQFVVLMCIQRLQNMTIKLHFCIYHGASDHLLQYVDSADIMEMMCYGHVSLLLVRTVTVVKVKLILVSSEIKSTNEHVNQKGVSLQEL